ncbi:peptidoglycan-binding domain-containing protein [Actinokineospora sp. 24-640]
MPETIKNGDTGPDVRLLQHLLSDLNYDVGPVDGDFGPRTEGAVRHYQRDHDLDTIEDGVCGAETWQSLEGQFGPLEGLRRPESVEDYAAESYGVLNQSMSAEDRVLALESAANDELTAAGVPYVHFQLDPATPPYAQFDFTTWIALIEPTPFEPANAEALSQEEQGRIAATVYHEARHAEQWFEIARLLAGLHGFDAVRIANDMQIPASIAQAATANPTTQCTLSNGRAFDWYESVYGGGSGNRDDVLGTLGDGDPANDRYGEYRGDLSEEHDSHDVGGSVRREYREFAEGVEQGHNPTVRRGDFHNQWVTYLQQLLQYQGYYVGRRVDSHFGPLTEEAVTAYQAAHPPLVADGVAGPATWESLIP